MKTAQQWFEDMKSRPCVTENDLRTIIYQIQEDAQREPLQRAINAEMELLALKSVKLPSQIKARMMADREKAEKKCGTPEWLSQALNEGDGTYKP